MDPRTQRALTLIARASGGDPGRPIPVQAVGLTAVDDACALYSVNQILRADYADDFDPGCSESLGLVEAILDSSAATGQPYVFTGPLIHYVTRGTADLFDKGQPGNMRLPVAVPSQGRWLVVNGTHRYAADTLLGNPVRLLLVTEPPRCRCPLRIPA